MNNNAVQIDIVRLARRCVDLGLSVLPIRSDGSKRPAVSSWKPYQERLPELEELEELFSRQNIGVGIIAGRVSGNLEILDFDRPGIYQQWRERVSLFDLDVADVIANLPTVETPSGGHHVYYRCEEIETNQKLAKAKTVSCKSDDKTKTVLIETRGEGGYVVSPGSPPTCHPLGKNYRPLNGVWPPCVPVVSVEHRRLFLKAARSLNEDVKESVTPYERSAVRRQPSDRLLPGDDFNARGPSWAELLEPHGWKCIAQHGETTYWRRPTKDHGFSATTGYCGPYFYNFSTNATPFEGERAYSKFSVYSLLNFTGDFRSAASQLAQNGYGQNKKTTYAALRRERLRRLADGNR